MRAAQHSTTQRGTAWCKVAQHGAEHGAKWQSGAAWRAAWCAAQQGVQLAGQRALQAAGAPVVHHQRSPGCTLIPLHNSLYKEEVCPTPTHPPTPTPQCSHPLEHCYHIIISVQCHPLCLHAAPPPHTHAHTPPPLRIVDVSTVGELCKRWFPKVGGKSLLRLIVLLSTTTLDEVQLCLKSALRSVVLSPTLSFHPGRGPLA